MLATSPTTEIFNPNQRPTYKVEYWDTPYTPLTKDGSPNDIASAGIPFYMREPMNDVDRTFEVATAVQAASAANVRTAFNNTSNSDIVVDSGRVANLVGYWAGGAPGYYGASVNRRVAMHWKLTFRSVAARSWFSSASSPTVHFAFGANGYVRIVKNLTTNLWGGTVNDGMVSEKQYLIDGLNLTASTTLSAGDTIDIFYVQDLEDWGGFVFKCVLGAATGTTKQQQETAREAPVIDCALFDDGTTVPYHLLTMHNNLSVIERPGQAKQASFRVPLINTQYNDGIGWEWIRDEDPTGYLRHHSGVTADDFDVRRQRLVRITGQFIRPNGTFESYPLFTGFIDDFDGQSDGSVAITCRGFEQRLADQAVKNYPDRISYHIFAFKKLTGATEPVYNVTAYDNWPFEFAIRDLMLRAGIDESRTRAALYVPQADGTSVPVVM